MSSIIVCNLPETITKNDLRKTFGQKGDVTNVQLVFNVDAGFCYFALISYRTENEAIAAQSHFDKTSVHSKRILVERCSEIDKNDVESGIKSARNVTQTTNVNEIAREKNIENNAVLSARRTTNLPYEEGQWSSTNPTGKKKYSKSFMLHLGNETLCQRNHDMLKKWEIETKFSNISLNPLKTPLFVKDLKPRLKLPVLKLVSQNNASTHNNYSVDQNNKKTHVVELANVNTSKAPVKAKVKLIKRAASMTPKCAESTSRNHIENSTNSEVTNKIDTQCKNIIQKYEQLNSLTFNEAINSLIEDKTSDRHIEHKVFVNSILVISLRCSPDNIKEAGTLFAKLISEQILCITAITEGIDFILKDHSEFLQLYPQFFSYIAATAAQLLISKTASFEFNNLKDAFISLKPNKSTTFFIEVLKNILGPNENNKHHNDIKWLYEKWWFTQCIHFDVFMSYNLINKYYKCDQVGVFLLSMTIYNKMKMNDSKLLNDVMHNWINTCIKADIIKCPHFIQALTIAIILVNATKTRALDNSNISFEHFIDQSQAKLLSYYISYEQCERYVREFQCLYGIHLLSLVLQYPRDMALKLCFKLFQDYNVISKDAYNYSQNIVV